MLIDRHCLNDSLIGRLKYLCHLGVVVFDIFSNLTLHLKLLTSQLFVFCLFVSQLAENYECLFFEASSKSGTNCGNVSDSSLPYLASTGSWIRLVP